MIAKVRNFGLIAAGVAVVAIVFAVLLSGEREVFQVEPKSAAAVDDAPVRAVDSEGEKTTQPSVPDAEASGDEQSAEEEPEGPKSADELREEEEKKVDAFDALTDKWMEKEGVEVTMKDTDEFVKAFKSVPDDRKGECLQRALNLVSDDHVLLLAGVLFDKSIDKELVELVFNDVLNRDESAKSLILSMIYKDKEHPCWADTAWILDVTGEKPKKENNQ